MQPVRIHVFNMDGKECDLSHGERVRDEKGPYLFDTAMESRMDRRRIRSPGAGFTRTSARGEFEGGVKSAPRVSRSTSA